MFRARCENPENVSYPGQKSSDRVCRVKNEHPLRLKAITTVSAGLTLACPDCSEPKGTEAHLRREDTFPLRRGSDLGELVAQQDQKFAVRD